MDLEHVSVEDSEYREHYYPAEPNKSTTFSPKETRSGSDQEVSSREIVRVLGEVSDKGLCGQEHVRRYLHELYCRNCRPNTIRGNGTAIILFLSLLKSTGRKHIETITRDDVSAFVEHEQDRGLTANTVSTRLRVLYAFFRFLIDHDVIHPDVLKRKMRIRVPDALPRAIDPEDIQRLLTVLKKPRDRALILTLLRTGMRIGELLNTKLRDLNLTILCRDFSSTLTTMAFDNSSLRRFEAYSCKSTPRGQPSSFTQLRAATGLHPFALVAHYYGSIFGLSGMKPTTRCGRRKGRAVSDLTLPLLLN